MLRVRKKLREARFFLGKMAERAQMAFGDHEEFDFYLSAFLSAGRSVDYRLRHEQGSAYKTFHKNWDKALPHDEQQLMRFMADDRATEVHESGSARLEHKSRIPVSGFYQDKSGTVIVSGPPEMSPAEIIKPNYNYVIDGQQIPVLDCCSKYTALLERLVKSLSLIHI